MLFSQESFKANYLKMEYASQKCRLQQHNGVSKLTKWIEHPLRNTSNDKMKLVSTLQ
mgnify:FL=1